VKGQIKSIADAASLSFRALDERIDEGLGLVAKDWNALLPYMLEMNRRLSAPGKRSDLRKGAPVDLTWTAWVDSKRSHARTELAVGAAVVAGQNRVFG
jgi:hypothetical protein